MKKFFAMLLVCLILMTSFSGAFAATERSSGDYRYIILGDGTAQITGYRGYADTADIPEQLDGYVVTSIGDETFDDEDITQVNIPDSVTSIGSNPFKNCVNLRAIVVSPSHPTLATIDGVLFDKVNKVLVCYPQAFTTESYTIPQGILVIGDYAFSRCENLIEISIPDSVITIGDYAFFRCANLSQITIPNSVISIGDSAFRACDALVHITIPDGVASIGIEVFAGSESLEEVTIPNSLVSIGTSPFLFCSGLHTINISSSHPVLETIDGVLFDKASKELIFYPDAFVNESYAIPQGTLSIGRYAFSSCDNLREITIPDSVISIGERAFESCRHLTQITLSDSVISIDDSAFLGCESLREIIIPDSVTSIGDKAFHSCKSLREIIIPDGITSIGKETFFLCHGLTQVTIPDSVTFIGDHAFFKCENLTFVVNPDSYAETYAQENNIPYVYANTSTDWLTN